MLRLMLDCARIAEEFGLGPPLGVAPLAGGHPDVTRLTTARGTFVVKPAYAGRGGGTGGGHDPEHRVQMGLAGY